MDGVLWSDYLCPWCYVGQDRSELMEELGVRLTTLPFELHPEVPSGGTRIDDRSDLRRRQAIALYEHIAALCHEVGLPFRRPERVPNTRAALSVSEWVRRHEPEAFPAVHRGLFAAHFVEGRFLGDRDVLADVLKTAGADAPAALTAESAGEMEEHLRAARDQASEAGVAGTPAWWLGQRLLVPGVQSREWVERVVTRLIARAEAAG